MAYLRIVCLSILLLASPVAASGLDGDRLVIKALKENGSDLSKPHAIDFFFDFPVAKSAQQVCAKLEGEGYAPHVTASDDGDNHTCRAVKKMVPDLEVMQKLTLRFNELAAKHGGVYDGWGCPVEY